jgi:hypothetical protein
MADYYPLIAGAVAGLERNTGENRRVLYERARAALVAQLRGVEPALEEADITRERLALEEAIRKVEADAAAAMPEPAEPAELPEPAEPAEAEPAQEPAPAPTSLRDRGLRDFYQTMAGADELGGAASHANRSARQTFDALPDDRRPPPADRAPPAPPRIISSRRASRRHTCSIARWGAARRMAPPRSLPSMPSRRRRSTRRKTSPPIRGCARLAG